MTSSFVDPFESERRASSSSSGSELVCPYAFSGYRDSLARIATVDPISEDRSERFDSQSSNRSSVSIDMSAFQAHRDTLARIPRMGNSDSIRIPRCIMERLMLFLPRNDQLNLRLVCRYWNKHLPKPRLRAIFRLPPEILSGIFSYLDPSDFDAARHVSRQWFRAGMDFPLLRTMLKAAGCQLAVKEDARLEALRDGSSVEDSTFDEWLIAKRLATTSRLSCDWRGRTTNGVTEDRLNLVNDINFRRALLSRSSTPSVRALTISSCSKYLLLTTKREVFVYRFSDTADDFVPVKRLAVHKDVLQVSMDTTSGRYAVAALLEHRVGVL